VERVFVVNPRDSDDVAIFNGLLSKGWRTDMRIVIDDDKDGLIRIYYHLVLPVGEAYDDSGDEACDGWNVEDN
jgi:hypothetical protein